MAVMKISMRRFGVTSAGISFTVYQPFLMASTLSSPMNFPVFSPLSSRTAMTRPGT